MKTHSKHKEYSLIVALVAGIALIFLNDTTNIAIVIILNIVAISSILYSAFSVVRHADVLAHRFGEPFGSLILTLSIVFLEVSLISILMLSGSAGETIMRDTLYSIVIIVMAGLTGAAMLLGGRKYKNLYFNFKGINHYLISIIPLAIIVMVLPTPLGGTYTMAQLFVVAFICLALYIVFLIIQTKTHIKFFVYEDEDDDGDHHGKPSQHSNAWHFTFLVIHLVAVVGVTKLNAYPLEYLFVTLNIPMTLKGTIIAILTLSPEGLGAISSTLKNQTQRAMNLLLGSVVATISLTVPIVVLITAFTGNKLTLGLDIPSIILLLCTLMICQTSLTSGKTNAHSGAVHLILFIIYIMLLF
jgi:Ca2+:H+ antiporter